MELETETATKKIVKKTKTPKKTKKVVENLNESESDSVDQKTPDDTLVDSYEQNETESNTAENTVKDNLISTETMILLLDKVLENFTIISKNNFKDLPLTKDSLTKIIKTKNKINKLSTMIGIELDEFMLKESAVSLKKKDIQNNKPKKEKDKSKYAINIPKPTFNEVLTCLKLPEDTEISPARVMQFICAYVKQEKLNNNPDIYVKGDNKKFNLIGDLEGIFDFIKKQMILRGDLENEDNFPKAISYNDIMKYFKYCFP
jgi:hypothetical protein